MLVRTKSRAKARKSLSPIIHIRWPDALIYWQRARVCKNFVGICLKNSARYMVYSKYSMCMRYFRSDEELVSLHLCKTILSLYFTYILHRALCADHKSRIRSAGSTHI